MSAQSPPRTSPPRPAERLAGLAAHAGWVAGLTLAGAALRFSTLSVQSFWLDESVTVGLVKLPFGDMLSAIPDSESTPPLYYVLAWLWVHVFGHGEVGLRSLSALIGTATIPLAYSAAARLVTPRVGVVVAALAAVNPLLVWFSQEARAYALLVLLTTASLAVFARVIERATGRALAGWALLSALALATHYFAIFVIAPEIVWLLLRSRRTPAMCGALLACAGIAAAGLALLPLLIPQTDNDRANFIGRIGLVKRIAQVPKQFLVGFDAPLEAAASVAALLLGAYGLWLLWRRAGARERRGAAMAARIAVPAVLVPVVLALLGPDYLVARNLIAAWVPCAIVVGAGFGAGRAGRTGIAAAAALCAVSLAVVVAVDASPAYQRGDWRGAARALGSAPAGGRALVITPAFGAIPFDLYSRRTVLPPGPVGVAEIDVIAVAERRTGQTPKPPRPATLPPPPPGFEPGILKKAPTYSIARYRASHGYGAVTVPILMALKLGAGYPDIGFQAPAGWKPPPLPPPGP